MMLGDHGDPQTLSPKPSKKHNILGTNAIPDKMQVTGSR